MKFLGVLPIPENMVLEGLGQDVINLEKDLKAQCKVSGRMAMVLDGLFESRYCQFEKN